MSFTPRDYQTFVVNRIATYLRSHPMRSGVVVMPTGTGKSVVIGAFAMAATQAWPGERIMCLTHVKELIDQNADKLKKLWPAAPLGIHSAGLKQRDMHHPIIYGGLQTVRNCVERFGRVSVLLVDEADLISPNAAAGYWKIIEALRVMNPYMVVIGFTATAFRRGQGMLTDKTEREGEKVLFDDIIIDMSTIEWWQWFIANGYLVPPMNKVTETTLDMRGVGVANGDYKLAEMNAAVDKPDLNHAICQQILHGAYGRHKLLTFAAGVDHAEHLAKTLTAMGRPTYAIHSRVDDKFRDSVIAAFHAGEIDSLTNNNVLTVGFDDPWIDHIACVRPTVSARLWVQMLGRGTRPCVEIAKRNCLVQDFAGNTARLGPINDPVLPRKPGEGGGEAPVKQCEACQCWNHASLRVCEYCGTPFEIKPQYTSKSEAEAEIFAGSIPEYEYFDVLRVYFAPHMNKKNGNQSIRVQYMLARMTRPVNEFIDFESAGFRLHVAHEFWNRFVGLEQPKTNSDALFYLQSNAVHMPRRLKIQVNSQYKDIVGYEY